VIFPGDRKPIVLVVDDEPVNIQILASLLNRDYEVKVATDGRTALAIAARTPQPDLILLDIMMPGMDGFEVCKHLKADAHTRDIPVIFVTAAGAESEAKCFELGAADYIAKPLNATITRLRVRTHLDIVRLRKVQQESLGFLRNMIDNAPLMIAVISRQGQCLLINEMALDALGYADLAQVQTAIDAGRFSTIDEPDFKRLHRGILKTLVSGRHRSITLNFPHHAKMQTLDVRLSPLKNAQGQVIAVSLLAIETAGMLSNPERTHLLADVFENAMDGIVISDAQGNIIDMNPAYCRITGYSPQELCSSAQASMSSAMPMVRAQRGIGARHSPIERLSRKKSGEMLAECVSVNVARNAGNKPEYYLGIYKDFSRHTLDVQYYDVLTGLPNRVLLSEIIKRHLEGLTPTHPLSAVCYLDLDGFRGINDSQGFDIGNIILKECAKRLSLAIRHSDTLGRMGGDEFVILLSELQNIQECKVVLDRILQVVAQDIVICDRHCQLSVSIGVALIDEDHLDAETWVRQADHAMYAAKSAGKNRYHFFDLEEDQRLRMAGGFLNRLQQAFDRGEFELFYQPKVRLNDQRLVGAEALVRWRDPERGVIAPGEFLPWLNGTALEIQLGDWVIAHALAQRQRWQQAGLDLELSINVSPKHLQAPGFIESLRSELLKYPELPPHSLQIEVLESTALEDMGAALSVMQACHTMGIDFALDDFGTGYSSLTYLCKLPVNIIKIDQSFIRDMLNDDASHAVVVGIIALSKSFAREIVAEGIETESHVATLAQMGCAVGQGYAIAKPMPAETFWEWALNQSSNTPQARLH